MAENRNRSAEGRRRQSERYYIDGNTARRLNTESEMERRRRRRLREQRRQAERKQAEQVQQEKPVIRREKRVAVFDLKYTLFLVVSVGITLGTCLMYMRSDAELTRMEQSVAALQTQLQDIQDKNRNMEESLNVTIDLNEVYREATGRLGMVYAGEDQVIYYNSSNSDYVRQYESIPGKK